MTNDIERCMECEVPTGNTGYGEESLYILDKCGPFCDDCFNKEGEDMTEINSDNEQVTINLDDYTNLLGDKFLVEALKKEGLEKLPMYDTAMLKVFLQASRKYGAV